MDTAALPLSEGEPSRADLDAAARAASDAYYKVLAGSVDYSASTAEGLAAALLNIHRSMTSLGPAMASVPTPTSAAVAGAIQSTENLWRSIAEEWGLLSSSEVARLLGAKTSNRGYASDLRRAGRILGVKRGQAYRYPGFQFDHRTGKILTIIPTLIAESHRVGVDDEDLVFWLCTPSGYFGGERPVDHLNADDLLEKLRDSESIEW